MVRFLIEYKTLASSFWCGQSEGCTHSATFCSGVLYSGPRSCLVGMTSLSNPELARLSVDLASSLRSGDGDAFCEVYDSLELCDEDLNRVKEM